MERSSRRQHAVRLLVAGLAIALAVALAAFTLAGCSSSSPKSSAAVQATVRDPKPPPAPTATTTPKRNGPFAVGRRKMTFVDASRSTPANGSFPAKPTRTLETIVEYPIAGSPDPGHEVAGAPALAGRFPIVIYLHGLGAHADDPYLHPWAAAGFVAIAPKFPLTNTDTPGGPNPADVPHEPADVSFVIDRMLHLRAGDADVQRMIDPSEIGVMGGSKGAADAYSVAFAPGTRDARIKAVIAQSCGCPPHTYPAGVRVPLMLMHGTADPFAPYQWSAQEFAAAPRPKYFVTLSGAKHIQYDEPWLSISARASIDFFGGYLKHEASALRRLGVDANVAGKARLQRAPA